MSAGFEDPRLVADALPENERGACNTANSLLLSLDGLLAHVSADVELFEESRRIGREASEAFKLDLTNSVARVQASRFRTRLFIAARDLSMNVFSFVEAKNALQPQLEASPVIRKLIDWNTFNAAGRLLQTHFNIDKDLKGTRDAVGHSVQIAKNPTAHAVQGSAGLPGIIIPDHASIVVSGNLHGSMFTFTRNNELCKLDVSRETVAKLTEVRDMIHAAIRPAREELKARYVELRTGMKRGPDGHFTPPTSKKPP
jgi:hypothetical protein